MTLPVNGTIRASQLNTELGRPANAPISMSDPQVMALAGKFSGQISFSDLYGLSYTGGNLYTVLAGGTAGNITGYYADPTYGYGTISNNVFAGYTIYAIGLIVATNKIDLRLDGALPTNTVTSITFSDNIVRTPTSFEINSGLSIWQFDGAQFFELGEQTSFIMR